MARELTVAADPPDSGCQQLVSRQRDTRSVNRPHVEAFVESWAAAWNRHDLDGILAHFADDAVFTSPIAAALMPETGGTLVGKDAIRSYWRLGLNRIPELRFRVLRVFTGVDCIVISYENQTGARVSEVLRFRGDLVTHGDGTYEVDDVASATGVRS